MTFIGVRWDAMQQSLQSVLDSSKLEIENDLRQKIQDDVESLRAQLISEQRRHNQEREKWISEREKITRQLRQMHHISKESSEILKRFNDDWVEELESYARKSSSDTSELIDETSAEFSIHQNVDLKSR